MSILARRELDFRFPKNRRLVASIQYRLVIAHNCRSKDALFVVYGHINGKQRSRLGVTVSRRVATRATERNRIKRVIREFFRCQQETFPSADFVVIARGATNATNTKRLIDSLEEHWRNIDKQCN